MRIIAGMISHPVGEIRLNMELGYRKEKVSEMNSKQMVLTGLVITSLITALVLTQELPVPLLAFVTLSLGLLLTYYWALSRKRGEYIDQQRTVFRCAEELLAQKTADGIDNLLIQWSGRITGGEAGVARRQGDEWVHHRVLAEANVIEPWLTLAVQKGETILMEPGSSSELALPSQTRAMLVIPLYQHKQAEGVFYLQKTDSAFLKGEVELLEWMSRLASRAGTRITTERDEKRCVQSILSSLLEAIESAHPEFIGHHQRVASIASRLGEKLALSVQEKKELHYAALLHDAGKIPAAVQAGDDDQEGIKQHVILGAQLLPDRPEFEHLKQGILYHHERYNGSGYPEGLKATEIPLIARIIAVADVYDALTRICPEEERLSHDEAVRKIRLASGSGLDPLVIVALEEIEPLPEEELQ